MFRNYVITALRNLARNKLYAGVNIVGLAVGFAAAILIALFVRDEFNYDTWIPAHARTYLVTQTITNPGHTPTEYHTTPSDLAESLRQGFPSIEAVASLSLGFDVTLRHDGVEGNETLYWADPNFFDLLPLAVIAGDLKNALMRPDSIVLTRTLARKYFGRDDILDETVEIDRQYPMRVAAVIEDLPSNTHLRTNIIASGLAASFADNADRRANYPRYTYVRLAPGASARRLEQVAPGFVDRHAKAQGYQNDLWLTPIADVHLHPDTSSSAMTPADDPKVAYALTVIGVLIVLVACINFVNLTTARATRRALEVGIRKVTGAGRRDLVIQFMGESLLYAILGMLLAIGLVELLLPSFNAFLDRTIEFNYRDNPGFIAGLASATVIAGVFAGFYPAFVLSTFRPVTAVKKDPLRASGLSPLRIVLVVVQFSVLIGLIVATVVISRQTHFALNEGLRVDKDQVILIPSECKTAFPDQVRALAGVRAVACSNAGWSFLKGIARFSVPGGTSLWLSTDDVDFGFFELYGLKPIAGRFFSRDHGGDVIPPHALNDESFPVPTAVINETAVRQLGFASPDAAVGRTLNFGTHPPIEIVGVVSDFSWDSIHALVPPSFYYLDPNRFRFLNVKLSGRDLPETLQAIAAIWKQTGDPKPITVLFFNSEMEKLYLDITRQGQLFGVFAGIALFLACLGLIGLAGATAERRTKEIGIRKAMGAKTSDILRLLTWEFSKPVIWANLMAWPIAYYFLNRWLTGFAYHIDLSFWMFALAGALAFVIALMTVAAQSLVTARAKPVEALRYE